MRVTSLTRTIVDVSTDASFAAAGAMADYALHEDRSGRVTPLCTRQDLEAQWQRRGPFKSFARAREVIDFATEPSDSVLESVSRSSMRMLGFPPPQLQTPLVDHRGLIGYTDFYWPEYRLVGEADGDAKYLDLAIRGRRSSEQVLLAQSKRENRLRAVDLRVTRWGWAIAANPQALWAHLRAAGQQAAAPRGSGSGRGSREPACSDTPGLQQMPRCGKLF